MTAILHNMLALHRLKQKIIAKVLRRILGKSKVQVTDILIFPSEQGFGFEFQVLGLFKDVVFSQSKSEDVKN